jgi:hypothetical protein
MAVKVWRRPFEWAGDTKRHEFLYDAQAIFKILSGISLGVALVFAFAFDSWQGALFFGAVALIASLLWITGTLLEHGARHGTSGQVTEGPEEAEPADAGALEVERRAARAGTRMAMGILALIVLTAIAAAVFLFDRATLGIGFVLALIWGLVFGAPYWMAAVFESRDEEREKQD